MPGTVTLPFPAADVLLERLGYTPALYPLDIPHHGYTHDERATIAAEVDAELARARLTRNGRIDADLEHALVLLATPEVTLSAVADLDGELVRARAGIRGRNAVLGAQSARGVRLVPVRSSEIIATVVDLIPPECPGPGSSVNISHADRQREGQGEFLRASPAGNSAVHAVRSMMAAPILRLGQFELGVAGARQRARPWFWFDTEQGRYLSHSTIGADGNSWTTYTPADNPRIAGQLREAVNHLLD